MTPDKLSEAERRGFEKTFHLRSSDLFRHFRAGFSRRLGLKADPQGLNRAIKSCDIYIYIFRAHIEPIELGIRLSMACPVLLVVGCKGVGKTSLVQRYLRGECGDPRALGPRGTRATASRSAWIKDMQGKRHEDVGSK